MCRTPLAANFGAALLLYSKAFKKPSFSSSQTFNEKLFYGSVCLSSDLAAERSLHADTQPFPHERPWVEIRACRENSYRYRLAEAKSQDFDSCESGQFRDHTR